MSEERISARDAADAMWPGARPAPVPNAITRRAEAGIVKAWADLLTKQVSNGETRLAKCPVPPEFWGGRAMVPNWESGDFTAQVRQNGSEREWRAFGVTFERSQIVAMAPPKADATASQQTAITKDRSKGGRPTKTDWEAVMIELARQLYFGELIPKVQADIEEAIAKHLASDGVSISESTIRDHARPLWRVISSEAGK